MSIYIDRKYLLLLSPRLEKFAQKKEDLYNFRCPLCGDSQRNKNKARGYVYRKANDYFYKCQNCGAGHTMFNFIKQVDANMATEYSMERYRDGEVGNYNYPQKEIKKKLEVKYSDILKIPSIQSLPENHFAKVYVNNRMIPKVFHNKLFFSDDFGKLITSFGVQNKIPAKENRLVLPLIDKEENIIGVQGRALGESSLRYITIMFDEDSPKIFGLDRLRENDKIYVVEGPIDSLFINNCIATCDSSLIRAKKYLKNDNMIFVFDNEPSNKEIVNSIRDTLKTGAKIVIWPKAIKEKDINDMIRSGKKKEEIKNIIDTNTYSGLMAEFEFNSWKKV